MIARQRDSYIHHETGTKNHNGWLNLRKSNLMLGHWLKRCYLMCKEMHGHSAAKRYHCLSREIPTDVRKLETKVIRKTRSTANQFDAGTLTEALPNEVERNAQTVSCEKHHCLSNRFLRTPQNWKQKSSETRSTKKSIWCSHIEPRTLTRKEIEFTHSKPEHYQWLSKRFFQKPRNWKQK